jgi:catechol 2,3-dioxygenase-like lactoylglutathione lyase family enzyme
MLANAKISATIPVTDLARAREFYEGVLGLEVLQEGFLDEGTIIYQSGGTHLTVYQRPTASSGEHTLAGFEIEGDFDSVIDALLAKGITFDTFEMPGVDASWDDRGVLSDGKNLAAWFKDPDGNVLVIAQRNR